MKARTLIPVKTLKEFEGEVKESVLRELKARSKTPRKEYIPHEEVRKALMK